MENIYFCRCRSLGEIWLNKSLTELALENKTTEKVMLKVKALAEAWVEIKDALLKKETLGIIQTLWGEHWDSPVGKSMKKARKIYSETS